MSKLNINRNIFLEREELLRWQKFMLESPVNKTFLSNTVEWGIIDTSGELATPSDFKIEAGSTSGTVKIANLSRALDSDGLVIEQSAIDNIAIPDDGNYYWLKIGHQYSNLEEGTISITADGQITGSGTVFTDILRGQATEVPVKIKLMSSNNTSIYDVVDVLSDTSAILQGESFTVENGIQYFVIGSTPLGDTVTTQQEAGLYYYDSCLITQVVETVGDTEPAGKVADKEFWIARVVNNSGTVTIEDKRTEYWEYFIRGVSDKLDKNQNLGDLASKSAARGNLVVYSTEQVDDLLNVDDSGWLSMELGSKVQESGTNIKIRRVGSYVNINGVFTIESGEVLNQEDVLFSIAYTAIGIKAAPKKTIYWQASIIDNEDENFGVQGIVEYYTDQDILYVRAKGNELNFPSTVSNKNLHLNIFYLA